ncbi:MAG: HAD-IA family hydrolase [Candidatus Abawacabacteria bacterium]|nr:HAD-IA family hydrolase [Candidatus Abawacabacteria bacterium]
MSSITTLIFDYDGVFTIDEYRGARLLFPDEVVLEKMEAPYYTAASSTQLWSDLCTYFHLRKSNEECIMTYNYEDEEQKVYKQKMFAYTRALAKRFSLILLSNQMRDRSCYLRAHEDFSFLKQVYFSDEIGLQKPDPAIFHFVLAEQKLSPGECLFVDDRKQNTDAAQALGMQIHTFVGVEDLKQVLG